MEKTAREFYYRTLPAQRPFGDWEKQPEDVKESWRERVRFVLETYNAALQ